MPASSSESRYRPVSGGVSVPLQRADHTGPRSGGVAGTSTVGSTWVRVGAPSWSGFDQYWPVRPWPPPDAGVRTSLGTVVGSGTSPSEPWAALIRTPVARAVMPASGVIAGPAVIGTAAEPPLMNMASSPDGPITASERSRLVDSGRAPWL